MIGQRRHWLGGLRQLRYRSTGTPRVRHCTGPRRLLYSTLYGSPASSQVISAVCPFSIQLVANIGVVLFGSLYYREHCYVAVLVQHSLGSIEPALLRQQVTAGTMLNSLFYGRNGMIKFLLLAEIPYSRGSGFSVDREASS